MKKQIIKKVVDGKPRYYLQEKKNIFSKWKDAKFFDKDGTIYDYLEEVAQVDRR